MKISFLIKRKTLSCPFVKNFNRKKKNLYSQGINITTTLFLNYINNKIDEKKNIRKLRKIQLSIYVVSICLYQTKH
jgi:hypothetical protein